MEQFPTTRWTSMADATAHGDTLGQAALEDMCRAYHAPVAAFIRAKGFKPEDVEDLVQEFFRRWIQSQSWKRAHRERGRFRSFVLAAAQHAVAHHVVSQHRQKRGGGVVPQSLEQLLEQGWEPPDETDGATPAFDLQWANTIVNRALARLSPTASDPQEHFRSAVLQRFLPGAIERMSLDDAAEALQLSLDATKAAVHRIRQKFREALRAELAATVSAPHEIDDEMAYLRSILARGLDTPPSVLTGS